MSQLACKECASQCAPPADTRLVLVNEGLLTALGADRVEWGEPDEHGWYTPTLYRSTRASDAKLDVERLRDLVRVAVRWDSMDEDQFREDIEGRLMDLRRVMHELRHDPAIAREYAALATGESTAPPGPPDAPRREDPEPMA